MENPRRSPKVIFAQAGPPAQHREHGHHPPSLAQSGQGSPSYGAFTREMEARMAKMMDDMHALPPSGSPDVDFLAMMIPHHWGAVEMARLVLREGRDPLVREIAEKIMAGQMTEIEGMQGRLKALQSGEQGYPMLGGNRGP